MSWSLFKTDIKINLFIWLLMLGVFVMYIAMVVSMFEPGQTEALRSMIEMLPEAIAKAINFSSFETTLVGFIASFLYSFLIFLFPLALSVVIHHQLVAVLVDRGSMAFILASPNSRRRIALTQAVFGIVAMVLYFAVLSLLVIGICAGMFPGQLDIPTWLALNLYAMALYLSIGGIGFFASCLANESRLSLNIGIGLPALFLALRMLGNANERLQAISKWSLYALFDPLALVNGESFAVIGGILLAVIGLLLYAGGILLFTRKNLYV